jgi:uncharacterized protein
MPDMPAGKPAGTPCAQLDATWRCRLFGRPERPDFCGGLRPGPEMCGGCREEALTILGALEVATRP